MKMPMTVLPVAAAIFAGGVMSVRAATPDLQRVADSALRMALKDAGFTIVDPADTTTNQPAKKLSRPKPAAEIDVRKVDVGEGISVSLVWCPPGRFTMGSPESENPRKSNELQHEEIVTNGFWIGQFEVSRQLWKAVTGEDPSQFSDLGDAANYPVENVSRDMCLDFIARLNERVRGVRFRLPTEAEWEYACRAGTTGRFGIGECAGVNDMQIHGSPQSGHPVACGSFRPNAWGLYDMHGNVSEWCHDAYRKTPSSRENGYVIRGGNWHERIVYARSAARLNYHTYRRSPQFGLRLVAE